MIKGTDIWFRHHGAVPVAVIDVGSNTVRLQVVGNGANLLREKAMLRLGESIERFADYSTEELARMLFELERGEDDRLQRLLEQIRAELARRALLQ